MDHKGTGLKLLLVGLLVAALLSAACNAGQKKLDPPKLHIRRTAIDVGEVLEGQDITHTYQVKNNGVGELHIINVRPG